MKSNTHSGFLSNAQSADVIIAEPLPACNIFYFFGCASHICKNDEVKPGLIMLRQVDFVTKDNGFGGCIPTTWFVDVMMRHFNQPYYVGLLNAAAFHGAAHQQPMVFQVMTTQPIRPIVLGQARLMFCYKKNILPDFYQPIKTAWD